MSIAEHDFDGLVAVVTGGASGIGAAIVDELQRRGARVAVLDLDPTRRPDRVLAVRATSADDASVVAARRRRSSPSFGGLDIVVNNAGIGAQGTVADNDDDEWHRVLDVNVVGIVRVSRAALPHLRALAAGGHRQHRLDRGDGGPARSGRSTARPRARCCR